MAEREIIMAKVYAFLADGLEEVECLAVVDVLRRSGVEVTLVSVTGDRALYQEMQNTSMEIENGIMETDAYRNFAERCNVKEIRKFASLVIQNLKKGNEELAYFLKDLSDEMWEVKKNEVKQKGEKANSRLLLPMMLIFIGILIMILVPVFQQMG